MYATRLGNFARSVGHSSDRSKLLKAFIVSPAISIDPGLDSMKASMLAAMSVHPSFVPTPYCLPRTLGPMK